MGKPPKKIHKNCHFVHKILLFSPVFPENARCGGEKREMPGLAVPFFTPPPFRCLHYASLVPLLPSRKGLSSKEKEDLQEIHPSEMKKLRLSGSCSRFVYIFMIK